MSSAVTNFQRHTHLLLSHNEALGWRPMPWSSGSLRSPGCIMSPLLIPCLGGSPPSRWRYSWTSSSSLVSSLPHSVPSKLWRVGLCCHVGETGGPHTELDWTAHVLTWSSAFITPFPHQITSAYNNPLWSHYFVPGTMLSAHMYHPFLTTQRCEVGSITPTGRRVH